eukprot:CAMPEP_0174379830 /NCGR_PEP_ID=MMETSP0811_2-20130205/122961_1 /TAXON_ID=73025 ORGANISM="Eutreptiella gymnastica-like, Strain CCMP1594" /NCGR_SAMPLE_ID=MMETSP0811_2 /ASSEMBLY_ACC=CAM_ASM_000667 /LENGTH=134 /DNA_ID=CAMNT_0015532477 /DNA_START=1526 /DNA_END=1930 /DNA_ORIENTATION=-
MFQDWTAGDRRLGLQDLDSGCLHCVIEAQNGLRDVMRHGLDQVPVRGPLHDPLHLRVHLRIVQRRLQVVRRPRRRQVHQQLHVHNEALSDLAFERQDPVISPEGHALEADLVAGVYAPGGPTAPPGHGQQARQP